jgi:outer membrane protein
MRKKILPLLFLSSMHPVLHAADLMEVYSQALDNDSEFKAAYSTFMANSEILPQARAALLPQLTLNGQAGANQQNVSATGVYSIKQSYQEQQFRLTASQTIFNYQSWAQVQQAKASVKAAHATFNDAAQNLILRTASAYLSVLYARDSLSFAEAKKRANKRQLDQATQRFNVGLDAITSVYNAQSAYDQSTADVIAATNNVVTQNENLRRVTNHIYDHLAPLRNSNIPLISPEPNNTEDWTATSIRQNYRFLSAKFNLQASRENIKVQSAGNWPVLSLQGNTVQTRNINPTGTFTSNTAGKSASTRALDNSIGSFFVPSTQQVSNIALAVNFPVFQGGLVESQTRQAQYNYQTASEQVEQVYRDLIVNSRVAFNNLTTGISKIKADRQTLHSQQNTVESTESQFLVGTRTMVDVVIAQQHLFEAQEQLAKDQYDFINAILNLKYLAGSLNVADLAEINAWLATTRINAQAPPSTGKVTS